MQLASATKKPYFVAITEGNCFLGFFTGVFGIPVKLFLLPLYSVHFISCCAYEPLLVNRKP